MSSLEHGGGGGGGAGMGRRPTMIRKGGGRPSRKRATVSSQFKVQLALQWNLSNRDILGPIKCVLIREVSSFQGANNAMKLVLDQLS